VPIVGFYENLAYTVQSLPFKRVTDQSGQMLANRVLRRMTELLDKMSIGSSKKGSETVKTEEKEREEKERRKSSSTERIKMMSRIGKRKSSISRHSRPDRDDSSPSSRSSRFKIPKISRKSFSKSTGGKSINLVEEKALIAMKSKSKKKQAPSTLETLPLEILTIIFLYSQEISLPQASPILAARLSSEYIIDQFLTLTPQFSDPQTSRLISLRLFRWDLVRYRPCLPELLFKVKVTSQAKRSSHHISERKTVDMPLHMVDGRDGWGPEKVALLRWFVQNGPCVLGGLTEPNPTIRDAAREGLWKAVEEGNAAAVILIVTAMNSYVNPSSERPVTKVEHVRSGSNSDKEGSGSTSAGTHSSRNQQGRRNSTNLKAVVDWHYPASQGSNRKSKTPLAPGTKISRVPIMGRHPFGASVSMGQSLLRHAILDSTPETFSRAGIIAILHFDLCSSATVAASSPDNKLSSETSKSLNLLDKQLWTWAEADAVTDPTNQDSNGLWLIELLKLADRVHLSEWMVLAFCKSTRRVTYEKHGLTEKKVGWLFGRFLWEWMSIYERVPQ
jgi:hypothetical protein